MGFASADDYQAAAQRAIMDAGTESFTRKDFSKIYYDYASNDFVVVSRDGYILTFYRPHGGQAYWFDKVDED